MLLRENDSGDSRHLWNFRQGNLRGDRRQMLKLYGYLQLLWNGTIGDFGIYQSGQPWESWDGTIYSEYFPARTDVSQYAEPAGSRRTDDHYQINLSYNQVFPIWSRFNILLRGELFNATDNQTGYNIQNGVNRAVFSEARSHFMPRHFQLTVGIQF